jgi:serine/threonine protein kinase
MSGGVGDAFVQAWPDRTLALEMHRYASVRGLAPRILAEDHETVTFERLPQTLKQWWEANEDSAERAAMRTRLRDRIVELHAIGICHRDLHSENVMVDDEGSLYFIDFALAQRVNPEWSCYDLSGPSEDVPVPYAHACQADHEGGVWWGPAISVRCLANVVGVKPAAGPMTSRPSGSP